MLFGLLGCYILLCYSSFVCLLLFDDGLERSALLGLVIVLCACVLFYFGLISFVVIVIASLFCVFVLFVGCLV